MAQNMDETESLKNSVAQHYNQNRIYEFEEGNKSDENKTVSDALMQRKNTKICLKNVPRSLKENGLRNLCGQYGGLKHVLFWNDRNYAFVTYASLCEAENAIRKINDSNTLGIKADFAFDSKSKKNEPFEEARSLSLNPAYETEINWNDRSVKGPFSHPKIIPDELNKMKACASEVDYESGDLSKADPLKEFINQRRNNVLVDFVERNKRIVNGRLVHVKNEKMFERIKDKSETSSGCYDVTNATFVYRSGLVPDPFELASSCSACKQSSDRYCRNCDTSFCTTICEAKDEIHTETCVNGKVFELKDAVDNNNQLQHDDDVIELPSNWIQKSNTKVKLTSFVDFKTIYVRPSNPEDDKKFIKLMNDVSKAAKTSDALTTAKSGLLVLVPFEMIYHRALILKLLNQNEAMVAFIDFGNVDKVEIAKMKQLPAELKKSPRMATRFVLKNVPDAMCNDDALNVLFDLLNLSLEATVRFDEPYILGEIECELNTSAIDSVNKVIINANVPKAKSETIKSFAYVELTGQDLSVLILDNSLLHIGQLSIIKSIDIDEFQRNHQRIQTIAQYMDRGEHITPGHLEYCLAKGIDNNWYRVQAIEVKYDGHITVLFIDYGNINILKIEFFRKMPSVLLFPCITAIVTCLGIEVDASPVIEAKRKEFLPNWSTVTFLELAAKNTTDEEIDGHCFGTLPPSILEQAEIVSETNNASPHT